MSDIATPAVDDGMHLVMDEAQRIITIRQLLECGVHFGHRTERWNPKMKQYIFGARNGVHIIDLQQTAKLLRRTYAYVRSAAADGQPILFVGTKRQAQDVLIHQALLAQEVDGALHVAIDLLERVLAVEHPRLRTLAELFDHC